MAEHHRILNSAVPRVGRALTCALAFSVLFSILATPRAVQAQDAFSCIEELSDDEVSYRIRYIQEKMDDSKPHATRWRYIWMSLWLAGGAGMTYAAVNAARDANDPDKFGWAYLAGGAYFFGLTHAILPAPDVWGAKRIRKMDDSTEEARRAKLRYATQTLKNASDVQELMGGALGVGAALIYGVVGGTIKATSWTGSSRGLTAALYVAPPLLLGIQTATASRGSVAAYEAYRGIACSSKYYQRTVEGADFDFSVAPGGANLKITF